ncbi:MAG: hypothetical protein ACXV2H_03430 [Actinomycetes bacterium]
MTLLALALLLLAATSPALTVLLRRRYADPTVLVAGSTVVLLALAALAAAFSDHHDGWRRAAALVLGVAAATTGGSDVVRATFRLIRGERHLRRLPRPVRAPAGDADAPEPAAHAGPPTDRLEVAQPLLAEPPADPDAHLAPSLETVLRGGAWIGYLERSAIAATLLAGWPEGMALVLAVKGVGRYPELKEPAPGGSSAPEAFIIGTLVSVLWAAAAAGTATLLIG